MDQAQDLLPKATGEQGAEGAAPLFAPGKVHVIWASG
jgi:hypothetical protein